MRKFVHLKTIKGQENFIHRKDTDWRVSKLIFFERRGDPYEAIVLWK